MMPDYPQAALLTTVSPPAPQPAMSRAGVATTWLVVLCQLAHGLTFTAIPLLLPLVRADLGITFTEAGLLSAVATLSYALGQIPAGFLADRFGPRRPFFIGLIGWSALSLGFALIHVFWLALVSQFIAGAFRAMMFAPGLSLLASWFPPERRATAMSLYMVGGFAGNIVLALAGPLLAGFYGWRTALTLLAVPGLIGALVFRAAAQEQPRRQQSSRLALSDIVQLARHPVMWACCGLQFARFSVVTSFVVWLPSFLVADRGLSVQAAGFIVAMGAALTAASNMAGGYVSDRLRNPPLVIGASFAALACTSVLLVTVNSMPLLLAVIAIGAIFLQFYFGPLFIVPVEVLGPRIAGTATGVGNLCANIGGLMTAVAFGAVKDHAGSFVWGYCGIGALCLGGVALSVALARIRTRALAVEAA
jgi:ACS family D-galactonate transporter-like MFS transporter